jgi:hypothetical protein
MDRDHEPARSQLGQLCEDSIEVAFSAGIQDMELQPEVQSRCLHFLRGGLSKSGIGRVDQQGHDARRWDQLVQQLQPFWRYPHVRIGHARDVAARPVKAGDEPSPLCRRRCVRPLTLPRLRCPRHHARFMRENDARPKQDFAKPCCHFAPSVLSVRL